MTNSKKIFALEGEWATGLNHTETVSEKNQSEIGFRIPWGGWFCRKYATGYGLFL